jgi:hypothetical protein
VFERAADAATSAVGGGRSQRIDRCRDGNIQGEVLMNDDTFNMQVRKFLKKVGIGSQREIEKAVREAIDAGRLRGDESVEAIMVLKLPALELELRIEDRIDLE